MMMLVRGLYFSFPVRLLALHFRNHLLLVALWGFILLMAVGKLGRFFGMHYLLLTPEYQGAVNFWSFFLTGMSFGAFFMIWNLTTYLLSAYRFPFLATLEAPFSKYSLNNSLIPLLFLSVYLGTSVWFQATDELAPTLTVVTNTLGFLGGGIALVLLLTGYLYLTNKDIGSFLHLGKFEPRPGRHLFAPGQRLPTLWEIQHGFTRWRVDTYLTERLRFRWVRSVAHYNPKILERVFRQNHLNAVAIQLVALLVLMGLGLFMEKSWVRIPTAAAVFLLASMVMALFGAITFWFRKWSLLVFLVLLVSVNYLTGLGLFNYRNRAYGLDYTQRVLYSNESLAQLCPPEQVRRDKQHTERILQRWWARNATPAAPKPKLVIVCVSGGGMRAALWTAQCLQQLNDATQGKLWRKTALVTGASGGMLGAAYLREVYFRQQTDPQWNLRDTALLDDISKDALNSVSFAIVSNDLFWPFSTFKSGNFTYRKDRGYLFERQFNENCRSVFYHRLADYAAPEQAAHIPMMILSPYVLNDARRLLISPQPLSYLMQPSETSGRYALHPEVDGVDFRHLFSQQQADSLPFTTALRMNCTFPLILPNVWLPTQPAIESMDAGVRDNYGIALAARFVHVFRAWVAEHTSGVVILQIRCWEKNRPVRASDSKGIVENLFTPAGAAASLTDIQDYEQDNTLALLRDLLRPQSLQVIRFMYRPVHKDRIVSMSLHLSKAEKAELEAGFYLPENQAALQEAVRALE